MLVFHSFNSYEEIKFVHPRFDLRLFPKDYAIKVDKQAKIRAGNFWVNLGPIYEKFLSPAGLIENATRFPAGRLIPLLEVQLNFERINSFFGVTILLPMVLTNILTVLSFAVESKPLAVGLLLSVMFFHAIFHADFLKIMPPAVGTPPKSGKWGPE